MDTTSNSGISEEIVSIYTSLSPEIQAVLLMRAALRAHFRNASDPDCFLAGSRAALAFYVAIKDQNDESYRATENGALFAKRLGAYRLSLPSAQLTSPSSHTNLLEQIARDWNSAGEAGALPGPFVNGSGLQYDLNNAPTQSAKDLLLTPLLDAAPRPQKIIADWIEAQDILRRRAIFPSDFDFWIEWYDDILRGRKRSWILDRHVVKIPEDNWENGASDIAQKILAIRAQIEVCSTAESAAEKIRNAPTRSC